MIQTQTSSKILGLLSALAFVGVSASAQQIVYDNSATPLGTAHYSNLQFGDEITLGGFERTLFTFQFEYAGDFTASGDETFQLSFYANNGAGGAPGSLLWSSPSGALLPGQHSVLVSGITQGGSPVTLPDTFTWTVSFGGVSGGAGDRAGLLLYNPPGTGSSYNDFWQNSGGVWSLNQINGGAVVANFAARVTAVPEPGTVAMMLLGLAGVLAVARRRN